MCDRILSTLRPECFFKDVNFQMGIIKSQFELYKNKDEFKDF